jgi:hypothetical protein
VKLPALALLALLASAAAAGAQPLPVGTAVLAFEERLRIGKECEPYHGAGMLLLSVFPDRSFLARLDAGAFTGNVRPTDAKGRTWRLEFDERSLAFYRLYLEAGGRALCRTDVAITDGGIESFVLRLAKDGSQAVLKLRTFATGPRGFGGARGRHRLDARGQFVPGLLPGPPSLDGTLASGPRAGSVTLVSPSKVTPAARITLLLGFPDPEPIAAD